MKLTDFELKMIRRILQKEIVRRKREVERFWKRNRPEADASSAIRTLEDSLREYETLYVKICNELNGGEV